VTENFEVQKRAWRPRLPEQPAMSQVSLVKAERARQNRAYVRGLLRRRQPGFAAALASAEQHLSCQDAGFSYGDWKDSGAMGGMHAAPWQLVGSKL
jgi:hypothetical protein